MLKNELLDEPKKQINPAALGGVLATLNTMGLKSRCLCHALPIGITKSAISSALTSP